MALGSKQKNLLNAIAENRKRIQKLEEAVEALSNADTVSEEDLNEATEKAIEELEEQFSEANLSI